MRWSRISYPKKIHMAEILVGGLKRFLPRFKNRGIDENYVEEIEALTREAVELKNKQNRIRGELKTTTEELQDVLAALGKKVSVGKVTVKVEMEQPLWTAFGITDKK